MSSTICGVANRNVRRKHKEKEGMQFFTFYDAFINQHDSNYERDKDFAN